MRPALQLSENPVTVFSIMDRYGIIIHTGSATLYVAYELGIISLSWKQCRWCYRWVSGISSHGKRKTANCMKTHESISSRHLVRVNLVREIVRGHDGTAQVLKPLSQGLIPSHCRSLILQPGGLMLLVPNKAILSRQVPVSDLGICQTLMG